MKVYSSKVERMDLDHKVDSSNLSRPTNERKMKQKYWDFGGVLFLGGCYWYDFTETIKKLLYKAKRIHLKKVSLEDEYRRMKGL